MNINELRKSFQGVQRGHGSEVHSIKSLSRRLLLSRQTVRKALASGELQFSAKYGAGQNISMEFKSAHLDAVRSEVVDEIINEIGARLQGLNMSEQEIVLTSLQALKGQKADIELQFATKSTPEDDEADNQVAQLIGGIGGGAIGANLGGRFGAPGLVGGAVIGSVAGRKIAGNPTGRDIAGTAAAGAASYVAHKAIMRAGGYRKVAEQAGVDIEHVVDYAGLQGARLPGIAKDLGTAAGEAGGRMMDVLKRALAKTAKAAA